MIDLFFDGFMKSQAGKQLLVDIPDHRKELVRKKLLQSFMQGVELGQTMFVINHLEELDDRNRKIILDFFNHGV